MTTTNVGSEPTPDIEVEWARTVLVLAGSYREFAYAKNHGLIPPHATHVRSEYHIMSYERTTTQFLCYGTWDERPYRDIAPLLAWLRSRYTEITLERVR